MLATGCRVPTHAGVPANAEVVIVGEEACFLRGKHPHTADDGIVWRAGCRRSKEALRSTRLSGSEVRPCNPRRKSGNTTLSSASRSIWLTKTDAAVDYDVAMEHNETPRLPASDPIIVSTTGTTKENEAAVRYDKKSSAAKARNRRESLTSRLQPATPKPPMKPRRCTATLSR